MVLAGEAEELVDAEFDGRMFEVRGGLEEVIAGQVMQLLRERE